MQRENNEKAPNREIELTQDVIKDGETILAVIFKNGYFKEGLDFLTEDKAALQVATWSYQKGKIMKPHAHQEAERLNDNVMEFVLVKSGRVRVDIYNKSKEIVSQQELSAGDFIIQMNGGHGYEILEEGTQVIEVKNGPYLGLKNDKISF